VIERVVVSALALSAMLASCRADMPESSAGSMASDTGLDRSAVAQLPSSDMAAAATSPADPQPSTRLLTPDGWGPLRIGMSRAEVVAAAGGDATPGVTGGPEPDVCDEFRPGHAADGVLVMLEKGVLTRISVSRNTEIETPAGFRVGDSAAGILAEYGDLARVEPHQYWEPPARYITVWRAESPGRERRGIRYEINPAGSVVHLRAGGPSIEYVEGCV
jgi:hypothetical protein